MIESLTFSFIYSLLKDGWGALRGRHRRLSPSQVVALRQKWKGLFEPHIFENYQRKLRPDVIMRDMKRIDSYPETNEASKGISPWFRVGLVGTYHRGILLGLNWETLTRDGENWRYTNSEAEERDGIKVILIGRVPYENIEDVDWDGDEYYPYPHIYCFFLHENEPYEDLGFYTETTPAHGIPSFTEMESYKNVRRRSLKLGIKNFR